MLELILVIGYIIVTTAIGWILSTRAKARNDINSFFVGKKELSGMLVCFITVSYTHLDVYKRQI